MSSSNGVDGAPRFLAASPSEVTATSGLVEPTGSQYGTSSTVSKIASATSATPSGELSPIEYFTQVEKDLVVMMKMLNANEDGKTVLHSKESPVVVAKRIQDAVEEMTEHKDLLIELITKYLSLIHI